MKSTTLLLISFLILPGCASYRPPPLRSDHPAHPDGPAAPRHAASKTLAYDQADLASRSLTAAVRPHGHEHGAADQQQAVVGEGKVIAIVPAANQIVIEHGEIKGFMEAMTMGYPVEPPSQLEGLKPGDQVRFTINVPKKTIVEIEKLK